MTVLQDRWEMVRKLANAHDPWRAREEREIADKLRRQAARKKYAPTFPAEWGDPVTKYWLVRGPRGEEYVLPIMPKNGPHLTVWRFAGFEATATFNLCGLIEDTRPPQRGRYLMEWLRILPPVGEWNEAAPTDLHSTLWTRLLAEGGHHE
jgi:hypothetical protein